MNGLRKKRRQQADYQCPGEHENDVQTASGHESHDQPWQHGMRQGIT